MACGFEKQKQGMATARFERWCQMIDASLKGQRITTSVIAGIVERAYQLGRAASSTERHIRKQRGL